MFKSDILEEKQRVQVALSKESASIHEYLVNSHLAAKEIADEYGFQLKYVEISNKTLQKTFLLS